jgi:hypothetical protein
MRWKLDDQRATRIRSIFSTGEKYYPCIVRYFNVSDVRVFEQVMRLHISSKRGTSMPNTLLPRFGMRYDVSDHSKDCFPLLFKITPISIFHFHSFF